MISHRYALPVILLLSLALVPTVIHSYLESVVNDGFTADAIDRDLDGWRSVQSGRKAAWVKETFDTEDWIERRYQDPNGKSVLLFVARSYDLKRLYHHPEIGLLRGVDLISTGSQRLSANTDVIIHTFRRRVGDGVAVYALLYEENFIENPVVMQLKTSFELLFSPRKPMTLFLVYEEDVPGLAKFESSDAATILLAAIKSFLSQNPG